MPQSLLLATQAPARAVTSPISFEMWLLFIALIVGLLLLDLLVLHRDVHVIEMREATKWSIFWIALGVAFAAVVYLLYGDGGATAAGEYLTGYLIEKSLSVDNLFVFVLIFSYFGVPAQYQHRVLFWGIFGALVFRGVFIALGAVLLSRFSWIAYLFGAFLIYTGYRMATADEIEVHPEANPILRWFRRVFRTTDQLEGPHLFVRHDGVRYATPLLAVLVVIETTDIVFAVDSIPAIFGVTRDPFLVFTSNAFALLGLRALYFLLADAVRKFRYLSQGIAIVLVLVGIKLAVEEALAGVVHVPAWIPLTGVAVIIGTSVWLSLRNPPTEAELAAAERRRDEAATVDVATLEDAETVDQRETQEAGGDRRKPQ